MQTRGLFALFLLALSSVATLRCSPPTPATDAADYYAGQTLRIIVPFGPGSGFDLHARVMAQRLGTYLPGQPTVVVENMPGAGGLVVQEMACELQKEGQLIAPLLLIDPTQAPSEGGWVKRARALAVVCVNTFPVKPRVIRELVARIAKELRRLSDQERIPYSDNDSGQREAALHVALAFRFALLRHRPGTYSGSALMIGSRKRLLANKRLRDLWRKYIARPIDFAVAGTGHRDVLAPGNEQFAIQLRRWLEAARRNTRSR